MEIYVYDDSLQMVGVIDAFQSVIWAKRYREVGDCEIYLEATVNNIDMLRMGYFLARLDDDMVCRIVRIELSTNAESGNYLTVKGRDIKSILDQRIIWGTATCSGNVEDFLRARVRAALISASDTKRRISNVVLGAAAGFTETVSLQVSYANLGQQIRDICAQYGWGYRMILNSSDQFEFQLYAGEDRSDEVAFSDEYENLSSTSYTNSRENMNNVALVGGQGEGSKRIRATLGTAEGISRYEEFVDAKDLSPDIRYAELQAAYPGGTVVESGDAAVYRMATLDIQIIDDTHLAWLQSNYTGTVVTVSGVRYFRMTNVVIADLPSTAPAADDTATLRELIYHSHLLGKGTEKLAGNGETETFEGAIIPDVTFMYKEDYFLGDIVYVENSYGIGANARITAVIEAQDENGVHTEPSFEYIA